VVLVDESVAGGVSSDRSAGSILDDLAGVPCALREPAMGAVRVVVLDIEAAIMMPSPASAPWMRR
jgi:hypothetical protein